MEGRGLWVFMSDGAPVDPDEEDGVLASELDVLQGHGDDEEDEVGWSEFGGCGGCWGGDEGGTHGWV